MAVLDIGAASAEQSRPLQIEVYQGSNQIEDKAAAYDSFDRSPGKGIGMGRVSGPRGSSFLFTDEWSIQNDVVELSRTVRVTGNASGGFLSSFTFSHGEQHSRSDVEYFAPGMIYGGTAHLTAEAIGGRLTYAGDGRGQVRIREDRLPAPMFGVWFPDGSALTVLDASPNGETTSEDSEDTRIHALVDERFGFGAIGADEDQGHHSQGFWFPGTEGEVTYHGNTYPGGQVHEWRRRYHPIRDGIIQRYRIRFRFSRDKDFPTYYKNAWRWAYATLNPPVTRNDIAAARRYITDVIASEVETRGDRAGIPNAVPAVPASDRKEDRDAIMGFTGKNLEAAEFLLADAGFDSDRARAEEDRALGEAIFKSFLRLRMNPPVAEGFNIETGRPALAIPRDHCVFLRSFGDDMKATLRAYRREANRGVKHDDWLAWAKSFGDWLLTQQREDGGFPRSWAPGSGEVVDPSLQSSYNAVPFLTLLSQETGDFRYLRAAERGADFAWSQGQSAGMFVGGTIDNPDVLDKEAGTLSLEAYESLYEVTHNPKWLKRAQAAADYAELGFTSGTCRCQ